MGQPRTEAADGPAAGRWETGAETGRDVGEREREFGGGREARACTCLWHLLTLDISTESTKWCFVKKSALINV